MPGTIARRMDVLVHTYLLSLLGTYVSERREGRCLDLWARVNGA